MSKVFAAWLLGELGTDTEFTAIVKEAAAREGAEQAFQTVAILGFAADVGVLEEPELRALRDGLLKQAGREPLVNGVPMTFYSDAVGVLGIAVGARALADAGVLDEVVRWTTKFLRSSYEGPRTEDWQRCLFAVADRQLEGRAYLAIPTSAGTADVRVALRAKRLIEGAVDDDSIQVLALAVQGPANEFGCERVALLLAAVNVVIDTVAPVPDRGAHRTTSERMGARNRSARRAPIGPDRREFDSNRAQAFDTATSGQGGARNSARQTPSRDAVAAKKARAMTVAKLIHELDNLKPQMFEDESEYNRLRAQYSDFLTFKIAEQRPDLKTKVVAIQGSTRHVRLAQELAGAHHGRELSTIQDDWKDFKPSEFKRAK